MQTQSVTTTQRIARPAYFIEPQQRPTTDLDPCLATGRWHPVEIARVQTMASQLRAHAEEPSTEPVPMEAETASRRWLDLETVKVMLLSLLLLAVVGGWLLP